MILWINFSKRPRKASLAFFDPQVTWWW